MGEGAGKGRRGKSKWQKWEKEKEMKKWIEERKIVEEEARKV